MLDHPWGHRSVHGRARRLVPFWWCVAAAALAGSACGGSTVTEGSGAAGSTSSSAGGSGGSGGSGATTGSGGAGMTCSETMPCPDTHFCATAPASCEAEGTCQIRPEACTDDCPGVCGCDGSFYCNACTAQAMGVDVAPGDNSCIEDEVVYSATAWPGGLDHIIIAKANITQDYCTMVMIDAPTMPNPQWSISAPAPWAVGNVVALPSAADCGDFPMGQPISASAATGTISWPATTMLYPCDLSIDAVLTFDNPPAWLPPSVVMDGMAMVQGGCF